MEDKRSPVSKPEESHKLTPEEKLWNAIIAVYEKK